MSVSEPNNLGNKQSVAPEGRGCIRRHLIREADLAEKNGLQDRSDHAGAEC